MGGTMVVPETDPRMDRVIELFMLTDTDLAKLYKYFDKLDTERVGLIPIETLFETCLYQRNLFTDALLELLDIDYSDGEINFSEFLDIVMTYCMFEKMEILKFTMSIFKEENADYIVALPDLKQYMDIIHNITEPGDHVIGNARESWNKLTFKQDLKITLPELKEIHDMFPKLFQPAFQLQYQMMCRFMGETWWSWKKNQCAIRKEDDAAAKKKEEILMKKNSAETRAKNRKVRRNMGGLTYYMCPCLRSYYDPSKEPMTDEELEAEKARQRAIARKKAAMEAKNPETPASRAFTAKVDPTKGGTEDYVIDKVFKTQRQREARAASRAERKYARKNDPELHHKFTTALNSKQ